MKQNKEPEVIDKIMDYLSKFEWKPISTVKEDSKYIITLIADLEDGEHKIYVKFSIEGKWIYFSTRIINDIGEENKKTKLFEKLLTLNYTTTLTKFGLAPSNSIYALIELPLPELNYSEFTSALRRLVNDVNKYTKELLNIPA